MKQQLLLELQFREEIGYTKHMSKVFLSVVIPAYKEQDNLKSGVLKDVNDYLQKQKYSYEVLIVDDGSPDGTADLADKISSKFKNFFVYREPHRGKGGTVIAGILKAKGEIILFTDMDQATPIKELEKIIPKFEKGYDLAIGSRSNRKGAPIIRKLMAYGFMVLRTIILRLPYKDTQCGFKALSKKAAVDIFTIMKKYYEAKASSAAVTAGFDLEMLYLARKLGYKVAEVPVEWEHKGTARVNPIRDSILGLKDMLRVRINSLTNKYGL